MAVVPFAILLAVVAGALAAMQAPTNAMLARAVQSPISAALISFLVGSAALALLVLLAPTRPDGAALRSLPWYAWIGGLYGAFFVAVAAFAAPRIGVGTLLTAMVAGQLAMAVALDHFGALGLPRAPVGAGRLLGLVLVIAGAFLVRRG